MSIIRYNTSDFVPSTFSSLVDRFFSDWATRTGGSTFLPQVDILVSDKAYEIHLAVPGMNKEDFNVDVKDNYLTVSGERKNSNKKGDRNLRSIETHYGTFSRSFALPENVEASSINARYNNGILEVTVPKDEKKALKTTIKVG